MHVYSTVVSIFRIFKFSNSSPIEKENFPADTHFKAIADYSFSLFTGSLGDHASTIKITITMHTH